MTRRTKIIIPMSLGLLGLPVASFLIFAAYINYIAPSSEEMDVCQFVVVEEPQTYYEGNIDPFHVGLREIEGRCVLSYFDRHSTDRNGNKDLEVGMAAPCNFIRGSWIEYKPLLYTYLTGERKVTVLLVTGGTPDPSIRDKFQPKGCGTALQKILVYADRISTVWTGTHNGPPWCPSSGADEVYFAA